MKKVLSLVLTLAIALSFMACTTPAEPQATPEPTVEPVVITDATELLTNVWAAYAEEQKFAISNNDFENPVMDAPGAFPIADTEVLDSILAVPAEAAAFIDGAAAMVHMMNANMFTCGAFHITDASNQAAFVEKTKENVANRQWMCGQPDILVIYTIGTDYVVAAFGSAENITNFKANIAAAYETATLAAEENLAA